MANASAHRLVTALAIGMIVAYHESQSGQTSAWPFVAAGLAGALGTLPDILEPALHPNHRQFFHSIVAAVGIGEAMRRLYQWQPETPSINVLRTLLLIGGGAYLTHLAMDALTSKSLPLVGTL